MEAPHIFVVPTKKAVKQQKKKNSIQSKQLTSNFRFVVKVDQTLQKMT